MMIYQTLPLPDIATSAFHLNQQPLIHARRIAIHQSWTDSLNVKPLGRNRTVIEVLVTPRLTPSGPLPRVEDTVSYLLGLNVAEGIARVHSATTGWHFPLRKLRAPPIRGENATCALKMCHSNHLACGQHLEEDAAASNYTQVTFTTTRYGYGWGLRGTSVILANVALLLHAALCLGHAMSSIWRRRTFFLASSIGEIIALAMNSSPAEKLRNTCAGVIFLNTWKKNVVVREVTDNHLELLFEDDSDDERLGKTPRPGKYYR